MNHSILHAITRLAFCAAVGLLFAACAHTQPKPILNVSRTGELEQYKRYERYPQRDFFHHFTRKAYRTTKEVDFELNSPTQDTLIEQWGKPQYIRKPFEALNGERVEEWIYPENQQIFQFIDHNLVFEGPITDYEQLLLTEGYPDHSDLTIRGSGHQKHLLVYRNIFLIGRQEIYSLGNDQIVYSFEGN